MRGGMAAVSFLMRLRGLHVVHLITVGGRSGLRRQNDLLALHDSPNEWIVVGSFAGSQRHPDWYYNMARNPAQIWVRDGGREVRVDASNLTGTDRRAAYDRMIAMYKGYAGYETKTDREIPVVRLTAVGQG
jgi:deazaflavin-dependent oxidoreductase (nitroreductase family)